jgi:hypothetical protein
MNANNVKIIITQLDDIFENMNKIKNNLHDIAKKNYL